MRCSRLARRLVLAAVVTATTLVSPHAADVALGQGVPQAICGGQSIEPPKGIGQPDANGWTSREENLQAGDAVRRYRFSVKSPRSVAAYSDSLSTVSVYFWKTSYCRDRVACWSRNTVSGLNRCTSPSRRHWYSPPVCRRRCARSVGFSG